jgi:hypothetical protein
MAYNISIAGSADSKKDEVAALAKAAKLAEELDARGAFEFSGEWVSIFASGPDDGVTLAKAAVDDYNVDADADDQVEA